MAVVPKAGETFQINNTKLYAPVVNLPTKDKIKFVENIKQGYERAISWNKYRSEITTQTKNKNLDYLTHPTFRNINRLFVLHSKIVMMILRDILLMSITWH